MTDDFEFKPAIRENTHVLIALAGAPGSGKTKSALELAYGLAGGKGDKIGMIDTEARRGLHYANAPGENDPGRYKFHHVDMHPPFTPVRFEAGIAAAERAGLDVLIIDSFSHEWDGEGGLHDWVDEIESGTPKPGIENPRDPKDGDGWKDWLKKPVQSPGSWKEPKTAHKHLVQTTMLQARCHLILCLRAEEKIRILKRGDKMANGQIATGTVIEPMGWMPICEKRFMFEMTLSFTLNPAAPGIPQFDLPHKLQDQHRDFFPEGERINREAGAKLAAWGAGGAPNPAREYLIRVRAALARATDAGKLSEWWKSDAEKAKLATAGLSPVEVKEIMAEVSARIAELKAPSTEENT